MITTEEMLYLLYSASYMEANSVTKGTVKSHMPTDCKNDIEKIFNSLLKQKLIELVSKGRFSMTELGEKTLVKNLTNTTYKFNSPKGLKVLNTLLSYIGKAAESQSKNVYKEMTFEEFKLKFKKLYFDERKSQALEGVVSIQKQEICKKFIMQHPILQDQFDQYFEILKTEGEITVTEGREDKLIEWIE